MMIKQNSAKEDVSEGKASSNQEKHHMLSTSFKSREFTNKFHNFFYIYELHFFFFYATQPETHIKRKSESWCKSLSITHIQQKTEQTNLIKEKMLEKHESIVCYLTPLTPYNSRIQTLFYESYQSSPDVFPACPSLARVFACTPSHSSASRFSRAGVAHKKHSAH